MPAGVPASFPPVAKLGSGSPAAANAAAEHVPTAATASAAINQRLINGSSSIRGKLGRSAHTRRT
jgi:hypothetical protein